MGKEKKKKKTVKGALFCVQLKMPFPQMSSSINGTGGGTNWCNLKRPLQREGWRFGFRGWPSEAFWSLSVQPVHRGGLHYILHYAKVTADTYSIYPLAKLFLFVCLCSCFLKIHWGKREKKTGICFLLPSIRVRCMNVQALQSGGCRAANMLILLLETNMTFGINDQQT